MEEKAVEGAKVAAEVVAEGVEVVVVEVVTGAGAEVAVHLEANLLQHPHKLEEITMKEDS